MPLVARSQNFATVAEQTGYRLTASYDETVDYARRLADASEWVHLDTFGVTPQGRPMIVMIVSKDRAFTPAEAVATGKVKVLVQNGIHAGEICGKEASFALIRDMVITREKDYLLDNMILINIPIFSIDGHENNGRDTRANQYGPENAGFRATAQGYNLNRDYLKAEALEMQAWLRLWQKWQPHFLIDDHVTDGVDWQYEISYTVSWHPNEAPEIRAWNNSIFDPDLKRRVAEKGYKLFPYAWPVGETYASGVATYVPSPRYSTGYAAIWNRPAMLVEIHSLKDFKTRVLSNYAMLEATFETLNAHSKSLKDAVEKAEAATVQGLTEPYALTFKRDGDSTMIDLDGYEMEVVESKVTGGTYVTYNRNKPRTYTIPYFDSFEPVTTVIPPRAYLIPQEWVDQIARLELHDVRLDELTAPFTATVEQYRLDSAEWSLDPYEGHFRTRFQTTVHETTLTFPAGTVVVDMHQPAAKVAMHALEPDGPDSFVRWGFWHVLFERKEYAEAYTIDPMAEDMLAASRKLRTEFEARLASDTAFANDPWSRRMFFYERSPYFEQQIGLYPVVRLMGELPETAPHRLRQTR
ncbi:MAG: M14 family metallopeptidase [Candidatus Zixiibacteriota bacterium]